MTARQTFRNTLIVIFTILGAYALYRSIDILIVLLVAIIVASAVRPAVVRLRKWGVSAGIAILIVYGALALAIFLLLVVILPPAVQQLAAYVGNQDQLAERILGVQTWVQTTVQQISGIQITLLDPASIKLDIQQVFSQISAALPGAAGQFGSLLGDFILVFVMGVYWLTAREQTINFVMQLVPLGRRPEIDEIINETETAMSTYVRGIVLVCGFVGAANFILLSLLGVPNPVTSGAIVGLTTALPIVGGYVGAAGATLLALLSSPLHAVFALGSFVAVQQVENHYLTPRVMSHSVGLDPLLVIVLLFTGFALGGVIGALIALPVASTLAIILRHLVIDPRKEETLPQYVDGGVLIATSRQDAEAVQQPKSFPT